MVEVVDVTPVKKDAAFVPVMSPEMPVTSVTLFVRCKTAGLPLGTCTSMPCVNEPVAELTCAVKRMESPSVAFSTYEIPASVPAAKTLPCITS